MMRRPRILLFTGASATAAGLFFRHGLVFFFLGATCALFFRASAAGPGFLLDLGRHFLLRNATGAALGAASAAWGGFLHLDFGATCTVLGTSAAAAEGRSGAGGQAASGNQPGDADACQQLFEFLFFHVALLVAMVVRPDDLPIEKIN